MMGHVSIASSRRCQRSTQAHASAVPLLSVGLDLREKIQDPVNVFVRLLSMRTDLGPARVRNQTMHLLSHPTGVDVVVARHQQGRRPQPPEHFSLMPRVRYGPSKRAEIVSRITWAKSAGGISSSVFLYI